MFVGVFLLLGAAAHPSFVAPATPQLPAAPQSATPYRAPAVFPVDAPSVQMDARASVESAAPEERSDKLAQMAAQFTMPRVDAGPSLDSVAAEVFGVSPVVGAASALGTFCAAVTAGMLLHARETRDFAAARSSAGPGHRAGIELGTLSAPLQAPLSPRLISAVFHVAPAPSPLRRVLLKFNSSSKWLVLAANTIAVWMRRDFAAPWIVVGAIPACFLAKALKKVINQARPAGAEPLDPGMPSSHSLVTFFLATSWVEHLLGGGLLTPTGVGPSAFTSVIASGAIAVGAVVVAAARVLCGFHTVPQILVGAGVGFTTASAWTAFGAALLRRLDYRAAILLAFGAYMAMNVLFVRSFVMKWLSGKPQPVVQQESCSQFSAEGERGVITPQAEAEIEPVGV